MRVRSLVLALGLMLAASPARADVITFDFAVEVKNMFSVFAETPAEVGFAGIAVGDTLTGSYTFDSLAENNGDAANGTYQFLGPTYGMQFDGGPSYNELLLIQNGLNYFNVSGSGLPPAPGFQRAQFAFSLVASSPIFSDVSLPIVPPSLGLFDFNAQFYLQSQETFSGDYLYFDGAITSLTVRQVPEPATLLLFGAGFVGIGGTQLRRKLRGQFRTPDLKVSQ